MTTNNPYSHYLELAKKAAEIGREVLMSYYGRLRNVEEKRDAGLVSEADKESEDRIREFLAKETPDFEFLGEEGGLTKTETQAKGRWICDPLDGTTNYIHQFPFFCVSVALEFEGKMVAGVIDVPVYQQIYEATRGGGSYLNGEKLQVSDIDSLTEGLFVTGFSYKRGEELNQQAKAFLRLMQDARGVRRTGSAAMDLCLVASGVFDGYWEKYLKPWDTAAAALIVQEAGGTVTDFQGNSYDPFALEVIASGPKVHGKLMDVLNSQGD